jgi:hypothetical protein
MADEERRMLFDIRGRRKNVIRVIYALLALLMAASLFVAVGPFNLAEVVGTGGSGDAADVYTDQAERIEERLAKSPQDEGALLSLTRARIGAGNALTEEDTSTGLRVVTAEAEAEYEKAGEAWERYLEVTDKPSPSGAQLVATTFFSVAENSETLGDIEEAIQAAVEAQRIAANADPSVGSLSTLAIFEYYNGEFAAGDKSAGRAAEAAPSKGAAQRVEKQMATFRKRTKKWAKQVASLKKAQQGQGKEAIENPLGGLSPEAGLTAP